MGDIRSERRAASDRNRWAAYVGIRSFADLVRAGLPRAAIVALAEADALGGIGLDRRAGLWQARGLSDAPALPLFAHEPHAVRHVDLPVMAPAEQTIADYRATGLSLKAHPLRFLRAALAREAVRCCAEAACLPHGTPVRLAGLVLVRQRPGNGNVVFCTVEDETGIANLVIWASLLDRFRRAILASRLLLVAGRVQRSTENVVHIIAERLEGRSAALAALAELPGAIMPRSRDFH